MNYLDASIRGIKFRKKNKFHLEISGPKKTKYDASIWELNPKRLKNLLKSKQFRLRIINLLSLIKIHINASKFN